MSNSTPNRTELIHDLVCANRILAAEGVVDGYGHVSVRSGAQSFLLAKSLAPESVTAADILEYGLDGEPLAPTTERHYTERFIHSEVYRLRPEVQAVVHNHSPAVIPFGTIDRPMRPLYHMSGFIGEGVPVWEIRDVQKGTDLLVNSSYLGASLARTLGGRSAALMRGHGCVVAAAGLPSVVGRSIYLELNARLQATAMGLSDRVTYLDEDECRAAAKVQDYLRAWALWKKKAEAALRAEGAIR